MNDVLVVDDLEKSYGSVRALRGVSLTVAAGEVVGLLGHNGAGKTTLVSIVAGLRRPDSGRVVVAGVDAVREPVRAARHLGLAPQDLGVYPSATVAENLRFFGGLAGLRRAVLSQRVAEVSEALQLGPLLDRRARELSGGQKRRLHTAAALLHEPPLLLLDEPTVGADVQTRTSLLEVVKGLAGRGAAVCYSTHYLPEVEALGATVAILENGTLIARGTQAELAARHAQSAVELVFDGPAPPIPGGAVVGDGSVLRVLAERPAEAAVQLLAALDGHETRLTSVDIVRDGLEAVYMALTGRHYEQEQGRVD